MNSLLKSLFLRIFWSGIGGEGDDPPADDIGELEDPEADDPPGDTDPPAPDDDDDLPDPEEAPAKISRRNQEMIDLRKRAQEAEAARVRAEAERDEARRGSTAQSQSTGKTKEQELWEQEEAVLNDPKADSWQRYAVQSARDAREARQESRRATFNAQDAADKAAFARIESSKPKTFAKYATKVEEMLTNMRKNGNNAPREELLALLIGRDAIKGNPKTEKAPAKSNSAPRGKTPGARSDAAPASMSARMTEAEKRAKRLENVRI